LAEPDDDLLEMLKELIEWQARTFESEAPVWTRAKKLTDKKRYEATQVPLSDKYDPAICAHEPYEDCLICSECQTCQETVDQDEVCQECREKQIRQPVSVPQSYHFSLGDSHAGPVGYCARVQAFSPEQAVEILQLALQNLGAEISGYDNVADSYAPPAEGLEYVRAYFLPAAITVESIDEVSPVEPTGYHNFYRCEDCNISWSDEDCDSMHDDECPGCNTAYTPYHSIPRYADAPEPPGEIHAPSDVQPD
jgi:hypothetical protein